MMTFEVSEEQLFGSPYRIKGATPRLWQMCFNVLV